MKNLLGVFLLLLAGMQAAHAVKIKSIYAAEVPVLSQDVKLREQAIQQAFVQTLSKMSGSTAILQNPVIKAALPNATNEVGEFGYVPSGNASLPYVLKVQFDSKAMKKLLREAKEPIWDESRPLVVAWLTVESGGSTPEVLDNQSNNEFAQLLKKEAFKRGLPLMLPIMDLTELNAVTSADIRAKSVGPLQKAAARYHSDGILIGSIDVKNKRLNGHWKLVLGPDQWDWDLSSDSTPELVALLTDKLVNTLAGRYAAIQTEQDSSEVTLVVKGVAEQDDFENMIRFVKRISLIQEMEIENVAGDEVVLHLNIQGAKTALMQEASVGQHLQLQIEKDNKLTYLWVR
jgi:hypothetical protein